MLQIQQFPYSADNLGYLVYGPSTAMAIDGGAASQILSFLRERHLSLAHVTNTHGHGDHTMGNETLVRESGATLVTPRMGVEKEGITIDGETVGVRHTPGHSADSVVFQVGGMLVTGDTLFNGTVGNCFSGDMPGFFQSLKTLMAFPADTIVYAGHDYVMESLAVAARLEPDNPDIAAYREAYTPSHVRSTLADELRINPYLRFNAPGMVRLLAEKGLPTGSEYERWHSVMSLE